MLFRSILLVHGIWDTGKVFRRMSNYLENIGKDVFTIDMVPNNGDAPLEDLARQVADYIDTKFSPEQVLDLVGFSMGGIVSRYYVQKLHGYNKVQRFITVSSPHHGTHIAHFSHRYGARQMRPNSPLLKDLNQDISALEKVDYTSIWTPFDVMILPANSSQMPVGKELLIPVLIHAWMLEDERNFAAIAQSLS